MQNPPPSSSDARLDLARRWAAAIATVSYVPMSRTEVEQYVLEAVDAIMDALDAGRVDGFERAGRHLVRGHFTGPQTLLRTVQLLGAELPAPQELVRRGLGALAEGYVAATRDLMFEQQEDIKKALLRGRQLAERNQEISEARFRGVFISTAVGIAITDLDGNFVETNDALVEILGHSVVELTERTLFDLVLPEDAPQMRIAYQDIVRPEVPDTSFRLQRRMVRSDGETAHVFLAGSVLHDADGRPAYYVTVVEDVSDLLLLQERLSHQALHDVGTGLPNRGYFHTTLEKVLGRVQAERGTVTLFHLDIDGFSVINSGLGHKVGDQLLEVVTTRLTELFAGEQATIARVAGDEFVVLVEDSPTTPDVATLAAMINEELSEPAYVGDRGLAVSASIGVVRAAARGMTADELIRRADSTLHRAKGNGKRQWLAYDEQLDSEERGRFALAASMPGALEQGEFRLVYQPQVGLPERQVTAVEAMLRWDHPQRGPLDQAQCLTLADDIGMVLPLGQWQLRTACEQAARWRASHGDHVPPVSVQLASGQANDPDLAHIVRTILTETGLPPHALQLGIPARSLMCDDGDADDNFEVLGDMGIRVVLVGFGGGHGGLILLNDMPVRAVKVNPELVARCDGDTASLLARGVTGLVELAHQGGATVIVPNIRTDEQANWWRARGADHAIGPFFARPGPAEQLRF